MSECGAAQTDVDRQAAFHELLSEVTRSQDVREILQHLGKTVGRIIPHDDADLAIVDNGVLTHGASTRGADRELVRADADGTTVDDPSRACLLHDGFDRERGFRSGLRVPVMADGQLIAMLTLFSRERNAYANQDLALAQHVADYVAVGLSHQRLAEAVRRAGVESSIDLLRTISEVLDIRRVFPRVSEIVNRVLPHDHLQLLFIDRESQVTLQAASTSDLPDLGPMTFVEPAPEFRIVRDLRTTDLKVKEPPDVQARIVAAGYRSALSIKSVARDQQMRLLFLSKRVDAYLTSDVPVARRIGDYIALAVSHEQLGEAERQAAEARARAERLEGRVKSLAAELDLRTGVGHAVGQSPEWKDVLKKATQVAATETTALLQGESGTGKEVVARFIHRASPRKDGPFVAINCAALPEQLLEPEVFGYERGAFTGAQQSKPGQLELASGGTLFLDEVSEMSLPAQGKFLRVLQEREFQRLGGTRLLKAHVRVIAATNRNLRKGVELGSFREDLYYRLQVFEIRIPPLRDRRNDVLPLADAFLQDISRSFARPPAGLTKDARDALLSYHWPGNVRELRNALERAAILCEGGLIASPHLMLQADRQAATTQTSDLNEVERQTIEQVLRETQGNKSQAAKRLGITRTQLYGRLRKYGLDPAGS
jgi:transcriptional regulator with PAS, ATPase and Fis domain